MHKRPNIWIHNSYHNHIHYLLRIVYLDLFRNLFAVVIHHDDKTKLGSRFPITYSLCRKISCANYAAKEGVASTDGYLVQDMKAGILYEEPKVNSEVS